MQKVRNEHEDILNVVGSDTVIVEANDVSTLSNRTLPSGER